jgi:hypothetical protein
MPLEATRSSSLAIARRRRWRRSSGRSMTTSTGRSPRRLPRRRITCRIHSAGTIFARVSRASSNGGHQSSRRSRLCRVARARTGCAIAHTARERSEAPRSSDPAHLACFRRIAAVYASRRWAVEGRLHAYLAHEWPNERGRRLGPWCRISLSIAHRPCCLPADTDGGSSSLMGVRCGCRIAQHSYRPKGSDATTRSASDAAGPPGFKRGRSTPRGRAR